MDFVNFRIGAKTISLKILDILLTERYDDNLTSLPNEHKAFLGVKDYMDIPTPVFDLGIMLNGVSTKQSNANLAHKLDQFITLNKTWFTALENAVENTQAMTNEYDDDIRQFVRWYQNMHAHDSDLKDILQRLSDSHQRLLEQAKLVRTATQEQGREILSYEKHHSFAHLNRLLETAKDQILYNYKPIIVFTTKDGLNPYIGLLIDRVEDSISVEQDDIKSLSELTSVGFNIDNETKHMMAGLIKLGDSHSVIIEPSAIFRPEHLSHNPEETPAYGLFWSVRVYPG